MRFVLLECDIVRTVVIGNQKDGRQHMDNRNVLEPGKLAIALDMQWGSSGKGKLIGAIANKEHPDFAISHNSVNASHWYVADDGFSYKFQQLPTSIVCPTTKAIIGSGAVISLPQLLKEIKDWNLDDERLVIHPNAVVITQNDIDYERKELMRIASTMTGGGSALGRKIMRHPETKLASHCEELKPFLDDTYGLAIEMLREGKTGLLEIPQGFDLSIDHGMTHNTNDSVSTAYPFVTSRNCDPNTFLGMSGIPFTFVNNVVLNMRTFPIRVGDSSNNKIDGYSGLELKGSYAGGMYVDQKELTWDEITKISNSFTPIKEMTSLTKRVRRVFSFSMMQLYNITRTVQPTALSINFVNYLDATISGAKGEMSIVELDREYPKVSGFVMDVLRNQYWNHSLHKADVWYLGTGPKNSEYIELTY